MNGSSVRRRLRLAVACGLSATLTVLMVDGGAVAQVRPATVEPPAVEQARLVTGSPVPVRSRPADPAAAAAQRHAPQTRWPEPGRSTVRVQPARRTASGGGEHAAPGWTRAAGLPVRLVQPAAAGPGAAPRGAAARPRPAVARAGSQVAVEVLGRDEARRAGVTGVLLRLTPAAGSAQQSVGVEVGYAAFAGAFGGDWGTRLRAVSVPGCALQTPDVAACEQLTPLASSANDVSAQTVSAVVPLPAASGVADPSAAPAGATARTASSASPAALVALEAAATGGAGDYTATPLSPSASWDVGTQTGSFSWSYPLRIPPGVNGPTPQLAIAYDSGSVDGRTSSTNNQPSWIGDGFSLESGYVERHYVPCAEDMSGGNNTVKTGDLCWRTDNASLVLGGRSGELVKDSDGTWRLKSDDGSRIERLTGATNADDDKEYWRLTTLEGTQYYFGLGKRYGDDTIATNSTSTVPVAGNQSGEPCFASGNFAGSFCTQAWRWNLDYVVDVHGNTMTYLYSKETNRYRRNSSAKSIAYDRAATLTAIEYGERKGSEATTAAPAKVQFGLGERCIPTSSFDCAASKLTAANASKWPDVPFEQICTNTTECTLSQTSPTFFTTKRLTSVTTQVRSGSAYSDVDAWTLDQSFPATGDSTSPGLWLKSISHVGKVGTATSPLVVSFNGVQLRNRVEDLDGAAPLIKWRVNAVDSETGGRISVQYSPVDCTASSVPSPSSNTRRCFPGFWTPEGATSPVLTWFHKYPVTQVVETDLVGGSPDKVTSYQYVGGAAWHYDDNELTRPKYRTWSDWRGYQTVRVRTGDSATPNTLREFTYLRGMDGDRIDADSTRSVSVTDSQGGSVTDSERARGFLLEEASFNGVAGFDVTRTIHRPWISAPTAGSGTKAARLLGTGSSTVRTRVTKGTADAGDDTFRTTRTSTTFDAGTGLALTVDDAGDTATTADDACTRTTYVQNTTLHLRDAVSRVETVSAACSATPSRPGDVLKDVRTYFDGATSLTAAPTRGLVTKTERLSDWTSGPVYTQASRATYDAHGRVLNYYDGLDRLTKTAYAPTTGGPVTQVATTNPLNFTNTSTLEPAWGVPVTEVDANGRRTDLTYDGLGRLTRVWLPGQSKADSEASNLKFVYTVRKDGPSAVKSSELNPIGQYTDTYALFDGLLRPRQTQAPASGGDGGRLVTETRYDSRGLVVDERGPYAATGDPGASLLEAPSPIPVQTETTYDGAGRVTAAVYRVLSAEKWRTTTSYEGDRVTTTPPSGGTPTTAIQDARGRMVEQRQYTGSTATGAYLRTTYGYRPTDDQLTSVTGPPSSAASAGATWTYGYDLVGRQIRAVDPSKGTTTTTYDAADQVTSVTDGRGSKLVHAYDALGRRTATRSGSATGTLLSAWTYDTVPNAKGKPATSTRYVNGSAYVSAVTGYDELYRPLGGSVTIPSSEGPLAGTYTTSMTYGRAGHMASLTLPAAGDLPEERLGYGYNRLGEAASLGSATGGAYVTQVLRTPFGEQARVDLSRTEAVGWQSYTYEEGTRRLATMKVQRANASAAETNLSYGYDSAGNITRIANAPVGGSADVQCFEYDGLRRLTHAWTPTGGCGDARSTASLGGAAPYWQSFTYDGAGNRLTEVAHAAAGDVTRTYAYGGSGGSQPDTLVGVTQSGPSGTRSETYGYDAAGNQTSRSIAGVDQSLTWDAEGKVASVTEGSKTTSFVHDADGARLLRKDPLGTTLYLPGGQELRVATGSTAVKGTRYYSFDGDIVAVRTAAGVTFLFSDHQGTGSWAVQEGTLAFTQRRFTPFGAPRGAAAAGWVGEKGFVGGTTDQSTGLTHLGARLYDPAVGRFVSVDPLFDLADPQSWNGYAYSNNSPITFSDASGLCYQNYVTGEYEGVNCGGSGGSTSSSSGGQSSSGGGSARQARAYSAAADQVVSAKRKHEEQRERIKKVATEVIKIAADELGITAGIDCFTKGDMGACAETAVTVLSSFVGGLAGKLVSKYGLPWKWRKGYELVQRLYRLGSEAIDAVGGWMKSRRELERAEEAFTAIQKSCPLGNSFLPGTLVVLADGTSKPIEDLQLGDQVLSADPVTGKTSAQPVAATIQGTGPKALVTVTVVPLGTARAADRSQGPQTVTAADRSQGPRTASPAQVVATDGHPFWLAGERVWVDAGDLVVGDQLLTADGERVLVTAVRHWTALSRVHNLSIADTHTYHVLAGDTAVLAHNCGTSSRAARRDAMRQAGIPTSQQPVSQLSTRAGRQYSYDVASEGGGTKRMVVTDQTTDRVPGHGPHWEAGAAKLPLRTDPLGRIRVVNDKARVEYDS